MYRNPKHDLRGIIPESWNCIDCGTNTARGLSTRAQMEFAIQELGERWSNGEGVEQTYNADTEVYTVRPAIWKKAGMEAKDGCLCVGCIEKRIGRRLKPKDFDPEDARAFAKMPCTPRLRNRRGG
jgi:hypothetical protein